MVLETLIPPTGFRQNMISSPSSIVLSCLGGAPVLQHLPYIMLQETELCLIVVTISYSSFKQEGLHLGLRAEAFLINELIDSPDDKINSLIIGPYKVIFSSLGIPWCTSTNLQSGWSVFFLEALVRQVGVHSCRQH